MRNIIESFIYDVKPDSWTTFYLFYFNQGHGSDASFQLTDRRVYIFVGDIMSRKDGALAKNNEILFEKVAKRNEMAPGELMHILTQLSESELDRLEYMVGAALDIDTQSGKAVSHFFNDRDDIKAFALNLCSQGATQIQQVSKKYSNLIEG